MNAGAIAGAAAASAGATAAAQVQAIKANGVVVQVEPDAFRDLVERQTEPLIVCSQKGFFTTSYQYLTSHKGLAFYTWSYTPITLPKYAEFVHAKSISIPQ